MRGDSATAIRSPGAKDKEDEREGGKGNLYVLPIDFGSKEDET
jgi:hypothetical protein